MRHTKPEHCDKPKSAHPIKETVPMSVKPKPPIRCTPCRVVYELQRYQIEADGSVRPVPTDFPEYNAALVRLIDPVEEPLARTIRQHASRLRRNRNARERNQARRDLGMKQTPWEYWRDEC